MLAPSLPHTDIQPCYAEEALAYLVETLGLSSDQVREFALMEGLVAWQQFEQKKRGEKPEYPWGSRVRARVVRDDWVRNRKLSPAERERIMWAE